MRPAQACRQCRNSKRKCVRSGGDQQACRQCLKRHLDCSGTRRAIVRSPAVIAEKPGKPLPGAGVPTGDDTNGVSVGLRLDGQPVLPSQEIIEDVVECYLRCLHDKPHALFHVPTLWRDVRERRISITVLFGILGLAARFSSNASTRARGPEFAEAAKRLFREDLENICLSNIQACILLGNIYGAEAKSDQESLIFGIAMRMAHICRLSEDFASDSLTVRETKRRIWWTLCMIDRWSSAGLGLPRQMHDVDTANGSAHAPELPMDEAAFHSLGIDDMVLSQPRRPGTWAYMIDLVNIFAPIQDLNRRLAQGTMDDDLVEEQVLILAQRFEKWEESLPLDMKLSATNIEKHRAKGQGGTFVALHLGFQHYATLLFFQYLDRQRLDRDKQRTSTTTLRSSVFASRCKEHASAYSDLLKLADEMDDCRAVYNIVGHMTVVSSSVLLHTLLFGDEQELMPARLRLESNFKILTKLKCIWPSVEGMMARLFTFQNACFWAVDSHTHKIDQWMVKFLLEHALPLPNKTNLWEQSSPTASEWEALSTEAQQLTKRSRITSDALSGLLG
ncbi:hypothetical protein ABEF92_008004 [Exophiala dermatitidis]|uniref:NADH dehydrogenase n=1 Tax=Exophiala dermatitidis (strain ATCC 34100 / CBS 525.76 / NIH/UT8656) TaxID=858893 RepID=H6C7B4_EXODN|nr:NADH dehydrogenase [Exophiala dermatitidis NIH/UT8656]EHY59610.1 NADH dehydrogenase [Exophiala dermatitidis NIH/UT8656]